MQHSESLKEWLKIGMVFAFLILAIGVLVFAIKYEKPAVVVKEPPVKIIELVTSTSTEELPKRYNLPEIIREWYPAVVRIECYVQDIDGTRSIQTGSGFLRHMKDEIQVLTNKHVITDDHGAYPELCTVQLPNVHTPYIVKNEGEDENFFEIQSSGDDLDWGYLKIQKSRADFLNAASKYDYCDERASLGTPIVILGYPTVGADADVTATQGIISGYDGDYYITDAKIGYGNSGGVAIKVDPFSNESCLLGIPTYAEVGEVVTLGRILDIQRIPSIF